jgi:hypothetical protein
MLRAIFRQPKIEFSPNVHVFAFDFMAEASGLSPSVVAGTVTVPPAITTGSGGASAEVTLLPADRPAEAIRFSSHWTKSLLY